MHAIQLENSFDATHPIIIPLKLNGVTSYFKVRKLTQKEYEDKNILQIDSWQKLYHRTCLTLNIITRNRVCSTTGDGLSALTLQQGDNCLSSQSHCMFMMLQMLWMMTIMPQNDNNHTTVLKSYATTSSLQVAKVCIQKVPGLDHLVLAKKWEISPKKALKTIHETAQQQICTVLHPSLSRQFKQITISYSTEDYHILCTVIYYLPLQCLGEATGVHRYLPPTLVNHFCYQ